MDQSHSVLAIDEDEDRFEVIVSMLCDSSPSQRLQVLHRETVFNLKRRLIEWELGEYGSLDCKPSCAVHFVLRVKTQILDNKRTVQSYFPSNKKEPLELRLSFPLGAHISASRYIWQFRRHGIVVDSTRVHTAISRHIWQKIPPIKGGQESSIRIRNSTVIMWRDRTGVFADMRVAEVCGFKNGVRMRLERIPTNQQEGEGILARACSIYNHHKYGDLSKGKEEETDNHNCNYPLAGLELCELYHPFGADSLSFVNNCYQREDLERVLVWDFSTSDPETALVWPSYFAPNIKEGDIIISQKEVQHWMVVVEVCDNGHPVVVDFCPASCSEEKTQRRHTSSTQNMIQGTSGFVGRSLLNCNGGVLYRACAGSYDPRRTVKNAELAHMLYEDEKIEENTQGGHSNDGLTIFTYSAIGLGGGFNCEDFAAACRDGLFEEYLNAVAQEYGKENPKESAIHLIRNISRLGHQVSGWEYRVAATGSFTAAFTLQALEPWISIGSSPFVLYTLFDIGFTAVDVYNDYAQVTQRRMAISTFVNGVKRKLSWCGARVVSFCLGGKIIILAVGGCCSLVFVIGGLIGVSCVTLAQLYLETDFLNRMGTHRRATEDANPSGRPRLHRYEKQSRMSALL